MLSLALSLGHNSSAVLIKDGKILVGYENERLSKVKSDSAFPEMAIKEIGKHYNLMQVTSIYVSHWETFGDVSCMSKKHWDEDCLRNLCPLAIIYSDVDHHDCHVEALRIFAGKYKWEIVADGFGNFNEVISIYKNRELIHRVFGFEKSLGLLYQYTTAYLGMKMNQDEYKLLGYESKINEVASQGMIREIEKCSSKMAKKYLESILVPELVPKYDAVAGLDALPNIRLAISSNLDYILFTKLKFKRTELSDEVKKIIVAYLIQRVVELVMVMLIQSFNMDEVALTGGLFMNVKLNNMISKYVSKICVMPVCGDQGAGIGAYQHHRKDLRWPGHLFWGKRKLSAPDKRYPCLIVSATYGDALIRLTELLHENKIVNFVCGNMEYGARALGHTTTFALPNEANVDYINIVNSRNTIMPMAGMVTPAILPSYVDAYKVDKSLQYMIITLDSIVRPIESTMGVHHLNPSQGVFTNRVQLINGTNPLYGLLCKFGILINTSFNVHGSPIVFDMGDVIHSHIKQKVRDYADKVYTIVVRG